MSTRIVGIDLFCGAGGLTYGLQRARIDMALGVDLDPACCHPYEVNNAADFLCADIAAISARQLAQWYPRGCIRLLAGCAPCSPFSPFRHGEDTSSDAKWLLLYEFERLVKELSPDLVTMENVPGLASRPVFKSFVSTLRNSDYRVVWGSLYGPHYGIPQHRRRLVLVASRVGPVRLPFPRIEDPVRFQTVRDAIGKLRPVAAGEADSKDALHRARSVSPVNLARLRASRAGGTWHDWPTDLRSPCHRRGTGHTFRNVYSRMTWDDPSPTITTQAYSFGTGRFGHPDQHRSLTLREAALLQTFPHSYAFVPKGEVPDFLNVGRLIGNAVPPRLGYYIGLELNRSVRLGAST